MIQVAQVYNFIFQRDTVRLLASDLPQGSVASATGWAFRTCFSQRACCHSNQFNRVKRSSLPDFQTSTTPSAIF